MSLNDQPSDATNSGDERPTPDHIMQIGLGFWASKTLLSAVELELFTVISEGQIASKELGDRLDLHQRGLHDFLDTLVALNLLERDGDGPTSLYRNTPATAMFLDKQRPTYVGGVLEMANSRLYRFWADLTAALRTGEPQNELKTGEDLFDVLYHDEARLEQFLRAMQGIQMGSFLTFTETVDLSTAQTFCDIGGANGTLAAIVAKRHPHLRAVTFDLPEVLPIAARNLLNLGIADRVEAVAGNFLTDDLPHADVITMGNVLHDWDETTKMALITKAYEALPAGGRFIAIENVIDDERRTGTFGLLMSLNMLIETRGGADYTGRQFDEWCRSVGFSRTEIVPLAGPASAAIAYK